MILSKTFSEVLSVSMSCFFCVKMMLKTAWERLLVSFMLVAATVLKKKRENHLNIFLLTFSFHQLFIAEFLRQQLGLQLLPSLVSRIHQVLNVIIWSYCQFGQIFDIRSQQGVFSYTKVSFVFRVQKITHTLTVDLHVAHLRREQKIKTLLMLST